VTTENIQHGGRTVTITAMLDSLNISIATLSEKPIIGRLLQLYLHDFSEFATDGDAAWDVNDDGLFQYKYFDSYWIDPGREPLLLRMGNQIVGFASLNDWSASGLGTDRGMCDFFILRKYRGMGLGKCAALEIIRDRPVIWEIPVRHYNKSAIRFWRSVVTSIDEFMVEEIAGDNKRWTGPIWRLVPKTS
jgi:predicted acetyltransferase